MKSDKPLIPVVITGSHLKEMKGELLDSSVITFKPAYQHVADTDALEQVIKSSHGGIIISTRQDKKTIEEMFSVVGRDDNYPFFCFGAEKEDRRSLMEMGVVDSVPVSDREHLSLVCEREFKRIDLVDTDEVAPVEEKKEASDQKASAKQASEEQASEEQASEEQASEEKSEAEVFVGVSIVDYEHLTNTLTEKEVKAVEDKVVRLFDKSMVISKQHAEQGTIYFWGGFNELDVETGCTDLSQRLERMFVDLEGRSIQVKVVFSAVPLKYKFSDEQELYDRADELLDLAKGRKEGSNYEIYCPLLEREQQANRGDAIALVEQALDNDGFRLMYQPIASMKGGDEELYDALLRIISPNGKEVEAGRFIGEIDKTVLAEKIDKWVVLHALKKMLEQNKEEKFHVFVHLSGKTVQDSKFLPWVYLLFKKANVNARQFVFQVSEENAVRYPEKVKGLFEGLNKIGCLTCLCHFGSTVNPLKVAEQLNAYYIKFDGKIGSEIVEDQESEKTLKELVDKVHEFGSKTIVPRVENPNMMTRVWRIGSDYVQGYFLQTPKPDMDYDFRAI